MTTQTKLDSLMAAFQAASEANAAVMQLTREILAERANEAAAPSEKYLDTAEVCARFGCARANLLKLTELGILPQPIRGIGKSKKWREADINTAHEKYFGKTNTPVAHAQKANARAQTRRQ